VKIFAGVTVSMLLASTPSIAHDPGRMSQRDEDFEQSMACSRQIPRLS
jgi:hypothetical protein